MPLFRLLASATLTTAAAFAQTPSPRETIAALADRGDLAAARKSLVAKAIREAQDPIITRPATLAELLEKYPWSMKYQEQPAHQAKLDQAEWERFALSLSDANLNGSIGERLPRLAAAYIFTKDERLADFIRAQLTELAEWHPIERPGTVSTRLNLPYAPWLGTGWGIRGITETLEILPDGTIPPDLPAKLAANLETEIRGIRQAWEEKRLWNTRKESAYSNQWVLPMQGLVHAAIFTGLDTHREDYELGVTNLLKSLDSQGAHGEFVEGMSYAALTMSSLLGTVEATARLGDRRLMEHPYLKKFPIWYTHHLQPGGRVIDAFDSKAEGLDPNLLSRFVTVTRSPEALWAIQRGGSDDFGAKLPGFIARGDHDYPAQEPPLWGAYDFAARINWRDSWDDATAAGFWMRGGHKTDAHDHQDRGHISFSIGDRRVLIEAGLASYGIPEHPTHYRGVAGHNVLQVGKVAPAEMKGAVMTKSGQILNAAHRSAPITVERLDATGGAATVDASGCYEGTRRWIRQATWSRSGVEVKDEVELKEPDFITFRWHLAAAPDASRVEGENQITLDGVRVGYQADSPVIATVEAMPGYDPKTKVASDHACVVIRTKEKVKSLMLNSEIGVIP